MKRSNFPLRRQQRREEALERDVICAQMSLEDRVLQCESRPGQSARELKRLFGMVTERDHKQLSKPEGKKRAPDKRDKKALKALKRKEQDGE